MRNEPRSSLRKWLIVSVAINIVLLAILLSGPILSSIVGSRLDISLYNYSRHQLCEVNYDEHIQRIGDEEARKIFSALTCGIDYETGEEIDFQEIVDLN